MPSWKANNYPGRLNSKKGGKMKKISFFIMLITILIILTACTTKNKEPAKGPVKDIASKSAIELNPIQIAANAEIVFFNNQKLYYYTDEFDSKSPELIDKTINVYDINIKTSKKLNKIANISTYSGSVAMNHSSFYMPFSTNDENILVKADMGKNKAETIKKWKTFPPLAYVYTIDNNLILFGPNEKGETTDYYINKINLDTNKEENIIKKKMKNQNGELIACMDVDDKYIYTFSIKVDGNIEKYIISQYDTSGTLFKTYPFDLKFYIDSATFRGQDDAILKIYKENDNFILTTLGGRVFVYKIVNDKLQPVKLPENLYKDNPSGFRFLEYYDGNSEFGYFVNSFKENNIVTVFNYSTEKITTLEFTKSENDRASNDYYRNAAGDLVIKKSKGQSTNEFQYFYYKKP